jgi:hypothetical protein
MDPRESLVPVATTQYIFQRFPLTSLSTASIFPVEVASEGLPDQGVTPRRRNTRPNSRLGPIHGLVKFRFPKI